MNEMEVISHLNVSVGLFPFTKILNLNIDHGPNVFGLCTIVGEMDHESADEIAQRNINRSQIDITNSQIRIRQRLSLLRLGSRPDCFAVWSRMFR